MPFSAMAFSQAQSHPKSSEGFPLKVGALSQKTTLGPKTSPVDQTDLHVCEGLHSNVFDAIQLGSSFHLVDDD